jgi:hypothetical protein
MSSQIDNKPQTVFDLVESMRRQRIGVHGRKTVLHKPHPEPTMTKGSDVIDFYGRTPEERREEFKNPLEEYLAWHAQEGTRPEKTWLGKLTIRVARICTTV